MGLNISANLQSWASSLRSPASAPNSDSESEKLQSAIESDSRIEMQEILNNPKLAIQALPNGELPLNYAIRHGHVEMVKWIVSKYPLTLDVVDCHGLTAINHAIISGNHEITGGLLGKKLSADINAVSEHFSKQGKFYKFDKEIAFSRSVTEYCTPSPANLSGVFAAAAEGNVSFLSEVLKSGADANATTSDGWSLLHLAVKSGNTELVDLLIKKGARVDLITQQGGVTALHVASTGTCREIIQRLLDAGASLAAADKQGSTPLHYAMTMDKLFTAQFLIEKGGKYSSENHSGMTPLSVMAAMARVQSDSKDELNISTMQQYMFAGIAASCLVGLAGGSFPLEMLSWAATIVPMALAFSETKSVAGKMAFAGTLAMSYIPGVNIVSQAWRAYAVGKECIKGLSTAWNYRNVETARPIRNAIIYGTNAAFMGNKVIESVQWAASVISELAAIDFEQQGNNLNQFSEMFGHLVPNNQWEGTAKFAFKRESYLDADVQIMDKAQVAFNTLQSSHNQTNIAFDEAVLTQYDRQGHTCSAMALDFVARMNNQCAKLPDSSSFQACVVDASPFYKANQPVFSSVQSAFNAIKIVGDSVNVPLDEITAQKMQALGSYHDMKLTPVSRSLYRGENVGSIIEKLPTGSYVVRLLSPTGNHKLETFGHTMGFIKREDTSIFYDNSKGARIIEGNVTSSVMENLGSWPSIPLVRLYKAECPDDGCSNLAETKVSSPWNR